MSKIKTKELIVCVIAVAILMLSIVTNVFAVDNLENLLQEVNEFENISIEENTVKVENNVNIIDNSANNTVNNTNTNKNVTSIPDTGLDYSVVFIIGIVGISSIYAYKKIRDYNNF